MYAGGFVFLLLFIFDFSNFAALSVFFTAPALYFFVMVRENNSNLSPAESRELNKPCQMFNFFDG